MKKPNPIDVVFKDKAKFGTQNTIIGRFLTQIPSGKTNEKAIEKKLRGMPFIKDLNIAKRLEQLKQYKRRSNNDDNDDHPPSIPIFDPSLYYPSSLSEDDSNVQDDLNPTQKFLLRDRPQKEKIAVAVGEKAAIAAGEKKLDFGKILANSFQRLSIFLIIK